MLPVPVYSLQELLKQLCIVFCVSRLTALQVQYNYYYIIDLLSKWSASHRKQYTVAGQGCTDSVRTGIRNSRY